MLMSDSIEPLKKSLFWENKILKNNFTLNAFKMGYFSIIVMIAPNLSFFRTWVEWKMTNRVPDNCNEYTKILSERK